MDLISQFNQLRVLKKVDTKIHYTLPDNCPSAQASGLVFSDAGQKVDDGQLSGLAGLLLESPENGSVFHTLSLISHKSKRPVKSVGAAKIQTAGESIDERKKLRLTLSIQLPLEIYFMLILSSRDLFNSLCFSKNFMDRSILADFNVICYQFEMCNVFSMIWVPDKVNLAGMCTKPNRIWTDALQLLLKSSKLPFDFPDNDIRSSDRSTG